MLDISLLNIRRRHNGPLTTVRQTPRKTANTTEKGLDFIRTIVQEDLGRENTKEIQTRFPPEPNGYLHKATPKSICLNFGIAKDFGGKVHILRSTTPTPQKRSSSMWRVHQEGQSVVVGSTGRTGSSSASDYSRAVRMGQRSSAKGRPYGGISRRSRSEAYRGTLTEPGPEQPFAAVPRRESGPVQRCKRGVPRRLPRPSCKDDMALPEPNLRDPIMYRISGRASQTGRGGGIYPTYDWAHGHRIPSKASPTPSAPSNSEDHAPLMTGTSRIGVFHPRADRVSARLNLTHTV